MNKNTPVVQNAGVDVITLIGIDLAKNVFAVHCNYLGEGHPPRKDGIVFP